MRLTVLLLMGTFVALATNGVMTNFTGVWVADIARCDFGTASRPMRLALNVTQTENRLNVIEVSRGEDGTNLVKQEYVFVSSRQSIKSAILGSAKVSGRTMLLESSDQRDQWRISKDGLDLIVTRWIGNPQSVRQILIFRRSTEIWSTRPSEKSAAINICRSSSVSCLASLRFTILQGASHSYLYS